MPGASPAASRAAVSSAAVLERLAQLGLLRAQALALALLVLEALELGGGGGPEVDDRLERCRRTCGAGRRAGSAAPPPPRAPRGRGRPFGGGGRRRGPARRPRPTAPRRDPRAVRTARHAGRPMRAHAPLARGARRRHPRRGARRPLRTRRARSSPRGSAARSCDSSSASSPSARCGCARPRRPGGEQLDTSRQPVGVGQELGRGGHAGAPGAVRIGDRVHEGGVPAETVQQAQLARRFQETLLLVLAVDLGEPARRATQGRRP